MTENGTRGVICWVTVQYAKANNEYTTKNFNKNTNEATVINDYDTNNFYGYAMLEKLPLHSYSWVNDISTIDKNFVINYNNGDYGYILEVDAEYLKKYTRYSFWIAIFILISRFAVFKTKKLLCTLEIKYRYVVHIKMLKLALQNGLKLIKVQRAANFTDLHGWNHIATSILN